MDPMSQTPQSRYEQLDANLFATRNDLPRQVRAEVIQQLNQTLADTTDLATQMKFAHWNVKGMNFYQLHLLFDEIAEVLEEHADVIAERVTALGGEAMGTVRMAAFNSRIPELDARTVVGPKYVEETAEHLAVHAANLRADIDRAAGYGDEDTADLYTELSREVDKQLYFLESHLQTQPIGTVSQAAPTGQETAGQPAPQGGQRPQRVTFAGSASEQASGDTLAPSQQ